MAGVDGLVDETTPPAPENIYGVTKLEAERLVLAEAANMSVAIVRISEVYGPGDRRLLKLFKAIQSKRFFHLGHGDNLHHPIFVDDLVRGLLLMAAHPAAAGEVFILPGKDVVTTNDMVAAVAAAVKAPPPSLRLPLWPFLAAARILETTLRPLGIQPPLHRRRMDFFRKSFRLDGSKAVSAARLRPHGRVCRRGAAYRPLVSGMRHAVMGTGACRGTESRSIHCGSHHPEER